MLIGLTICTHHNISIDFENKSEAELINTLSFINHICEIGIKNISEL